jgi:quercetin dioxygenase-like cupin family protein
MRLIAVLTMGVLFTARGQAGDDWSLAILHPAPDLVWTKDPDVPGGLRAGLMGDGTRPDEVYVMMARWEAGTYISPHRHMGMCHGVIVEGTIVVTTKCGESAESSVLPPGSFFAIGNRTVHSFRCLEGGGRCQLYFSQPNTRERVLEDCPGGKGGR